MNNIAIQLTNVTKTYAIHHEKPTLVEKFIKGRDETFIALNHINLTIYKGDKIGIIGANGSGKTTLLKIISGITTPTKGNVIIAGKVVSLIDLEAGFHPDLSGYQNIFINGMLLGMTKKGIENRIREIIEFADIHQFIDAPLFTYSSGMLVRLGFAVAVHSHPDILVMDENMSVGDIKFQAKAKEKLKKLASQKITIIRVSHWLEQIKKQSDRIIWIDHGLIKMTGKTNVVSKYIHSI